MRHHTGILLAVVSTLWCALFLPPTANAQRTGTAVAEVRVRQGGQLEVPGQRIRFALQGPHDTLIAWSDNDGTLRIAGLRTGRWRIVLKQRGYYQIGTAYVQVNSSKDNNASPHPIVIVQASPTPTPTPIPSGAESNEIGVIRGQVLVQNGADYSPPEERVKILVVGQHEYRIIWARADGTFSGLGFRSGQWKLTVRQKGYKQSETVDAQVNVPATIVVTREGQAETAPKKSN